MNFIDPTFLVFGALCATVIANVILSWKDRRRQIKIDTARVFWDLLRTHRDTRLAAELIRLQDPKAVIDPNAAAAILYQYETIATLWAGKTLDKKYVKAFFGNELIIFRANKSIMLALTLTNKQRGGLGCPNLVKLLERSIFWERERITGK